MGTSGAHNPTLTAQALAAFDRMGSHGVEECSGVRRETRGDFVLQVAEHRLLPHGKAHAGEISRKLGKSEPRSLAGFPGEGLTLTRVLGELKRELATLFAGRRPLTISKIA